MALLRCAGWRAAMAALLAIFAQPLRAADEYSVKAAFLYHFSKFVSWPAASMPAAKAPFAICIYGRDPFGAALPNAIEGKSVGDHPIEVRRIVELRQAGSCQILFVSTADPKQQLNLASVPPGVLTVGEADEFLSCGGMIQLRLVDDHVKMSINVGAAERANLKLSALLLNLAEVTRSVSPSCGGPR